MKYLFIIQGEGRGHLTQALSLRQKLIAEGNQVVGVLVGKSPARRLPSFFVEKMGLGKSIGYNLFRLHNMFIVSVISTIL